MPQDCYQGKTPTTCTSSHAPGKNFLDLICWTYLAQMGLSHGGGVQDQAKHNQTKWMIQAIFPTDQLTMTLLNSSYNLWWSISQDRDCWICFPFSTISSYHRDPHSDNTVHTGAIGRPLRILNLSSTLDILTINSSTATFSLPYCTPPGVFLSCPGGIYRCLTANDSLDCIFILLSPSTTIYSHSHLMSILFPTHRDRRAAFTPLLTGAGLTTGVATGAAGLGTSINFYYKLSQALNDDMEWIADSLSALQTQITSLAAVALQNRRASDLLTAKKGGTCLYLNEECCYYVNQSGIVTSKIRELRDRIQSRRQDSHLWGVYRNALRDGASFSESTPRYYPCSRLPTSDCPYHDAQLSAGSSQNTVDAPHTIKF
ncbi:unnamed protein product [Nyctereutes procyonoides]|uniref:(raccoon dog) hypothetical protein n=1 Tax=Nyctereutes procyonoides TaxID=34880 RepID=A0A811Y880_NYCPR|nr:unnamed protein product [Nyctereutes procyonoides]